MDIVIDIPYGSCISLGGYKAKISRKIIEYKNGTKYKKGTIATFYMCGSGHAYNGRIYHKNNDYYFIELK